MKRTPLIENHRKAGAKLVGFAEWEMPIQYSGVLDEYHTVRTAAGLFDVSHMGRITVEGREATAFLQQITTNNVEKLAVGAAQYSMVCNPAGGIKDDIFVYRGPRGFMLCVNASNRDKIVSWLFQRAPQGDVRISDESDEVAQIALQGPHSPAILKTLNPAVADTLKPRHWRETELLGVRCSVSRTGYTGEVGYELYLPSSSAGKIWDGLVQAGQGHGVKPCGLGARDLLRLDVGYLLYGNDIDEDTTPLEAGVEWAVDLTKPDFVGKAALILQQEKGLPRKLVAFELLQKAVPRHGMKMFSEAERIQEIGIVTSGNLSPKLQKGIGLGYVAIACSSPGTEVLIDIRGHAHPAKVVRLPFYKRK